MSIVRAGRSDLLVVDPPPDNEQQLRELLSVRLPTSLTDFGSLTHFAVIVNGVDLDGDRFLNLVVVAPDALELWMAWIVLSENLPPVVGGWEGGSIAAESARGGPYGNAAADWRRRFWPQMN